jgi:hypothetical protein
MVDIREFVIRSFDIRTSSTFVSSTFVHLFNSSTFGRSTFGRSTFSRSTFRRSSVFRQLKKNFFIHLKNTNYPQFMATCSMVKVTLMYINLTKNGLGHTLGDFITNSSVALVLSCHANLICPSTFGFSLPKQNFRHDFCATRKVECEQGDQIGRIFAYRAMVVFGQFSEN